MHGGRVELESKLGEGSAFTVYLPVEPSLGFSDGLATDDLSVAGNGGEDE